MLDGIFSTCHYKLIINTFILIFNSSRAFSGQLRVRLFVDFRLGRWFPLFCHWSYNVSLSFHHLLYRTTILRRSHINWDRYYADEMKTSKGTLSFSRAPEARSVHPDDNV